MRSIFTTKEAKRKDDLKDLLSHNIVNSKNYSQEIWNFIIKHYKIILIAALLIFSIMRYILFYNSFVVLYQKITNAKAHIESTIQMRQNIIPALTVVVYQFINHENNIFLKTVEARGDSKNDLGDIDALKKGLKSLSSGSISNGALTKFIAVAENYPQLVTSQSYQLLIGQISEIEKQIYTKRLEYNDEVNIYNTKLSIFPDNAIGLAMGFEIQPYFQWKNKPEWIFTSKVNKGELPVQMESGNSKDNN